MNPKRILLSALFFFLIFCANAQSDSTVLTYQKFIENILLYHPVANQAELQKDFAKAEMLKARGNFDPVLYSDLNEKQFDKKNYYQIFNAGMQIPSYLGLSLLGNYENTNGDFLNPENTTTNNGLWTIGVEANLLQGMFIDERRAALKQARIYQNATQNERVLMLNELLFSASVAYLNWQMLSEIEAIIQENLTLANNYFNATKEAFLNGSKPAIDTLEAFLIIQDRLNSLQKNQINLQKAKQELENFLWFKSLPLELQANTFPDKMNNNNFAFPLDILIEDLVEQNPQILQKEYKLQAYEIEQKLNKEKLKPKLKVKYQPLLATNNNDFAPNYSESNYKWGFDFSIPILLRTERGKVRQTNLKMKNIDLEIENKQNNLKNKIEATILNNASYQGLVALQNQTVINYKKLLDAEQIRFEIGESSVFLLNKRQEKYLESRIKFVDVQAKLFLNKLEFLYYSGNILETLQN